MPTSPATLKSEVSRRQEAAEKERARAILLGVRLQLRNIR